MIDASVALKWLVAEDDSDTANELVSRTDLMAPTLIHAEVANGLRKKIVRAQWTPFADLATFMERLASIIQPVDDLPVMGRVLAMAATLNHCVYLALAEQLDRLLVTADHKFLRKVEQSSWASMARAL